MQKQATNLIQNARGFLIAVILLSLSGCSLLVKDIRASYTPVEKPELALPDADEVRMREIEWFIITEDNYEEVFTKLKESGNVVVLLGLTSTGYENLSLNLSDIRAFVQQQQAIIKAYKGYYLKSDRAMDDANDEIKKANSVTKEN
jgi:Cys-tRNA synthase (O-phospho-L-seryl-tRNA:Cys-tRNA synthase)